MTDTTKLPLLSSACYVAGFKLDGRGGGAPLTDASATASQVWIHLDYSEPDCVQQLTGLGLPEAAIDGLVRVDTRPRVMQVKGGILLIQRAVNLNPGENPEDMVSLRFWLEQDRLITVRQRRLRSTQEIRQDIEQGNGPLNIQDLLFAILDRIITHIAEFVDELEEKLDAHETRVDSGDPQELRREVGALRRQAAAVRRFLAPQRDALESFHRQARGSLIDDNYALYIHEQADRLLRYLEDLDLVREKALLVQEELMNRIAQEQNARMYVLSIVAAIFLPVSFVTGLFGMNVAGLPGVEEPRAFMLVVLGMLTVTTGSLLWFRYKRWL